MLKRSLEQSDAELASVEQVCVCVCVCSCDAELASVEQLCCVCEREREREPDVELASVEQEKVQVLDQTAKVEVLLIKTQNETHKMEERFRV